MNSKTLYVHSYVHSSHEKLMGIPEAIVFCPIPAKPAWTDASIEQEARAVCEMLKARMPGSTWRAFVKAIMESVIPVHTYKDKP